MNEAERSIVSRVKGFLVPIFSETLDNGEVMNGLAPDDFYMVRDGYACGRCLAIFDTYTVRCPVCGLERDVGIDVRDAPQLWLDHLHEREHGTARPPVENPLASGAPLRDDPEVEQIPLSKLRKRRRG